MVPIFAAQPPAQNPPAVKHSDDDRIYDEVRRKLANDLDVKGAGIEVAVKNGAVTLRERSTPKRARRKPKKSPRRPRA